MRLAGVAIAAALLACGGEDVVPGTGTDDTPPPDLIIDDVRVVDVATGSILSDHTVAIADGAVTGVWAADQVPAEVRGIVAGGASATVIDGAGRYLMAGLWDAHVHFRGGEELRAANRELLRLYPAFGVTTVRDAGGDLTEAIFAWRDSIAAGDLTGPRILTSGPKLDGPRPSWDGSIALSDPAQVPAALDSLQVLGVDYVKLYDGTMSPQVFLAAVREAEARGMTVTGHMPLGVDFLEAVQAGLDGTEHLYYLYKGTAANRDSVGAAVRAGELGFWDAFWAVLGRRDAEREVAVFAAMAESGTAVVPTLHIGDVLSTVEQVDHSADSMLELIPDEIEATYAGRVRSAERSSLETREANRRLRREMAALVAPLQAAGVTILAGSDAGPFNSYTYPGAALHAELEALVAAGLTPAEALRAATTAPATFMGLGDELGRVAPGYVADLILLDENPLSDIRATRSVSTVILRGDEVLDRRALEALRTPG